MRKIDELRSDRFYMTGILLLLLSLIFYCIPVIVPGRDNTGLFLVNYVFTAIFGIGWLVSLIRKKNRTARAYPILFLLLGLVSAYALNRDIPVFLESVPWFAVMIIITSINFFLFTCWEELPMPLRRIVCILAGTALVMYCYFSLYLIPLYPISAAGFFILGISLHSFFPLLFAFFTARYLWSAAKSFKPLRIYIATGISIPVLAVIIYALIWNHYLKPINEDFRYSTIRSNNGLPTWVQVAQKLPSNPITYRIMTSGILYSVPQWEDGFFEFGMPRLNFERKLHDPLVMISSFLCGPVMVPEEDRVRILESVYDARHQTQERLFSGKDLATEQVRTNVQLWRQFGLAYTEMNVVVTNRSRHTRQSTQEAIYTFHLPEGAVATSLSLWIEGNEEKGVLTTRSKADTAYKTIVGVESRDPSVVHWQEGNTVTVRVFPVLNGESRQFKLGISSPLSATDSGWRYTPPAFDGPAFSSAREEVNIEGAEHLQTIPDGFIKSGNRLVKETSSYSSNWSIAIEAQPLSTAAFQFDSCQYRLAPLIKKQESFEASSYYLDINETWTSAELNTLYAAIRNRPVYVSTGEENLTRLTEENHAALFSRLQQKRFSLFPFFRIQDSASALVITKSALVSPSIDQLRGSRFLEKTDEWFRRNPSVRLYEMGSPSVFIRSLKEFGVFRYESGDLKELTALIANKTFPTQPLKPGQVPIAGSNLLIEESDSLQGSATAPDHLMRLYAYNHILQQAGRSLFSKDPDENGSIDEAARAHVVTPFSSLVVLEKKEDYERFNIAASQNSLENASLKSSGAVPEPHEWALIVLAVFLCLAARYPHLITLKSNR